MKKELGIARCGLACALCSENTHCPGCNYLSEDKCGWCINRKCSKDNGYQGCYECNKDCNKGLLNKIKPLGFTIFIRRYGIEELLKCLERNEKNNILYHVKGILGDYDDFTDVENLINFIKTGKK